MINNQLKHELEKFKELKSYFNSTNSGFLDLDEYGIIINQNNSESLDLMIFGLTHGDEVIGLQIINLILEKIKTNNLNLNIGFMLNNIKASILDKRYIDRDLNRSFSIQQDYSLESRRAVRIGQIILESKPKLIIDLHQTIENSKSPFCVIPEKPALIKLSQLRFPKIPIICFSNENGFSISGQTLIEFSNFHNIPSLVFEIGKKGFHVENAQYFSDILVNLDVKRLLMSIHNYKNQIEYYLIKSSIPLDKQLKLKPHLENLENINKDDHIAFNKLGEPYKAPHEGKIVFPSYQKGKEADNNLGYIAVVKHLNDL